MDLAKRLNQQRKYFKRHSPFPVKERVQALQQLKAALYKYEEAIYQSLRKDLNKPGFETMTNELGIVLEEIKLHIKNAQRWTRPQKVGTPIYHFLARSYIYQQLYGQVLVMAPWNYPLQLSLQPVIGAITAGNCVILKPSEIAPHTSRIIKKIVREAVDKHHVDVVEGDVEVSKKLLEHPFDYIFFTGSPRVGKIVMRTAAEHLTPLTLELGGKSPCIIDESANLKLATQRLVWGKFLNAGQTCIAPDYLFVHRSVKEQVLELMRSHLLDFYGEDPQQSPDYAGIISKKHTKRLSELLQGTDIYWGGQVDIEEQFIAPTIVEDVDRDHPLMQEEIFGPILPVLAFEEMSSVIDFIDDRPEPLALYLFSERKSVQEQVIRNTTFGGGCINDTLIHVANSNLPFGGIGGSGFGKYHGKSSFDTFSNQKSITKRSNWFEFSFRYPPYTSWKKKIVRWLMGI